MSEFITQFETMRKMMKGLGGFMKGAKKGKMPFGMPKFPFQRLNYENNYIWRK